ncbi:MAG: glutathione peroxidase [Flavisolibacter sp.]
MLISSKTKKGRILTNTNMQPPTVSFYSLIATLNNKENLSFSSLNGKRIMIVNTASDCGYTTQYEELKKLKEKYKDTLEIIGFPSNDFGDQEKKENEEIALYCSTNFNVNFPLTLKSSVKKSYLQNNIYKWLTDKTKNGWNDHAPDWNFAKYLINENGILIHYFGPAVSPLNIEVTKVLET